MKKPADAVHAVPGEAGEIVAHRVEAMRARLDHDQVAHDAGRRLAEALRVEEGAQRGRVVVAPWPRLERRRGWAGKVGHVRNRPPQHDDLGELVEGDEAGQVGIFAQLAQDVGMVAELRLVAAQDVQPGGAARISHVRVSSAVSLSAMRSKIFHSSRSDSGGLHGDGVPGAQEVPGGLDVTDPRQGEPGDRAGRSVAILGDRPGEDVLPLGVTPASAALSGLHLAHGQPLDEPVGRLGQRDVGRVVVDVEGVGSAGDMPARRRDAVGALHQDIDAGEGLPLFCGLRVVLLAADGDAVGQPEVAVPAERLPVCTRQDGGRAPCSASKSTSSPPWRGSKSSTRTPAGMTTPRLASGAREMNQLLMMPQSVTADSRPLGAVGP